MSWIFEDRDANIWFGTGNGASRYDGKSITNFTTKDGLVHDSVYTIAQDAAGRIWFGTQGGVCSYDGKSFSNLADRVGRSLVNVRSMVVDRSGNLWFGGQQGAFRYDGKTVEAFTSKEGLLDDSVGSMIVDRAGNLRLGHPGRFPDGSGGGATRYDRPASVTSPGRVKVMIALGARDLQPLGIRAVSSEFPSYAAWRMRRQNTARSDCKISVPSLSEACRWRASRASAIHTALALAPVSAAQEKAFLRLDQAGFIPSEVGPIGLLPVPTA